MASIMTNVAAMTALQALTATNKSLQTVQNHISTGYRVATASDNAAYWSIATTMRSDNKALSTVSDALGLGSAQVDTAYTAMDSAKNVLDDIKTQLVAAKEPGIDKAKIQSQIDQDLQQLKGIASSATFSGSNWLSVDSSSSSYQANQKIVSSFSRDANGNISIGTVDVDLTKTALLDANTANYGLLQSATAGTATSATAFSWTQGEVTNGDTVDLSVTVDGGAAQNISVTIADAANFTVDDLVSGINASLTGATASKDMNGNLIVTSDTTGTSSAATLSVTGFTDADASGAISTASIGFTGTTDVAGTTHGGDITNINITNATDGELDAWLSRVDSMTNKVTTAASDLGAVQTRIGLQQDFVSKLMDAVDKGVGQLVDADMNKESTKLQALQVQQQLGIQALSIANSSSQSILSLFR